MMSSLMPLLEKADRGRYALAAFNVTNLETALAVACAAAATRSPVIMQTSESAIAYAGHELIVRLIEMIANTIGAHARIVSHVDHGKHLATVKKSIQLGYRSVHMDASEKRFPENVRLTKAAVVFARRYRVPVQGELGYLLGYEGMRNKQLSRAALREAMTDPDQAAEFVQRTGVDTLALAIGTAHGVFRGRETIDFPRLNAIRGRVRVPLVLHGGSGVPRSQIRKAIANGIRIINIDTALRISFVGGLHSSLSRLTSGGKIDIRALMHPAIRAMEKSAVDHLRLTGSYGKA